jgi:hypothetical protein
MKIGIPPQDLHNIYCLLIFNDTSNCKIARSKFYQWIKLSVQRHDLTCEWLTITLGIAATDLNRPAALPQFESDWAKLLARALRPTLTRIQTGSQYGQFQNRGSGIEQSMFAVNLIR